MNVLYHMCIVQRLQYVISFFEFQSLNADLQKFVNDSEMPEILLSVCYNATLSRLTVNVIEAKNVKVTFFYAASANMVDRLCGLCNHET